MSDAYIGEIRIFSGNYAPHGWALCEGQELLISGNEALFSLIGATWGGNGRTTFKLPDLRGRLPIGSGTGAGLTPRAVAETGGSAEVSLKEAELPPHTHRLMASKLPATSKTPTPALVFAAAASPTAPGANKGLPYVIDAAGAIPRPLANDTIASSGAGQPHPNLMPGLAINFIIALTGVYPTKD